MTRGLDRPFMLVGADFVDPATGAPIEHSHRTPGFDPTWADFWSNQRGWKRDLHFDRSTHSSFTDLHPPARVGGQPGGTGGRARRRRGATPWPARRAAGSRAGCRGPAPGARRSPPTCRRAWPPLADLQIEYSLISRAVEADVLPALRELGIGLTAYGVLSRGLISGHWSTDRAGHSRSALPRFASGNVEHNLALVEALRRVAEAKGCTVAQLAIAWVAAQGADIVPLVGARTRERLAEALPAIELTLTADDLAEVEEAVPPGAARGDRYPSAVMAGLGMGN